jgi:hypothetical protein
MLRLTTKGKIAILILLLIIIGVAGFFGVKKGWIKTGNIKEKIENITSSVGSTSKASKSKTTQEKTNVINLSYDEWVESTSVSPLFVVIQS